MIGIISLLFLSGCNERLRRSDDIVKGIGNTFPNAEFVNTYEKEENSDGEKTVVYQFNNGEFDFAVNDILQKDSLFGILNNSQTTDYASKVYYLKEDIINEEIKKSGIDAEIEPSTTVLSSTISVNIKQFSDIRKGFELLDTFYSIIEEYLPNSESSVSGNISLNFHISNGERLKSTTKTPYLKHSYSTEEQERNIIQLYIQKIREGTISDDTVPNDILKEYKPMYLKHIYVNNELYTGEYEPNIIYNPNDKEYYICVGYGISVDYNGGVNDGINRDIVTKYHKNTGYQINNGLRITEYSIGNDNYKVKRDRKSGELTFYRNNEVLNVPNFEEISGQHSNAVYFRFISLHDFADVCGLVLTSIDEDTNSVHFHVQGNETIL